MGKAYPFPSLETNARLEWAWGRVLTDFGAYRHNLSV